MECPACGSHVSSHSRRCKACGKAIPPAQHLLEKAGVIPPSEPPAPVMTISVTGDWRAAGLGDRLIAAALDHVVILGGCVVVSLWSFRRWGVAGTSEFSVTTASLLMASLLSAACAFVYLCVFEAGFECTLGKAIVGLRVVRTKNRGKVAACAIRNALRVVDGVGFYLLGALVAACSGLRQRVGDMVAGTFVVEESFSAGVKVLAMMAWFAALVLSGWGVVRVSAHPLRTEAPRYFGGTAVEIGYAGGAAHIRTGRWRAELQYAAEARANGEVSSVAK